MRRRAFLAGSLLAGTSPAFAAEEVDLLLVLAVDVSQSIVIEDARLQREGYRNALTDPRVLTAIATGPLGAIAVAYVEWGGYFYHRIVVPWTKIAGPDDAYRWSDQLGTTPPQTMTWTSISGGLEFSGRVLAECPFAAPRRVIDVSGDGGNNNGPPPEPVRDRLVMEGITINGLPIVTGGPVFGTAPEQSLESYYRDSVIGGPGAFLVVAENYNAFGEAIRRKLIQEIATARPQHEAMRG
jgi:hypothetical protein